MVLPLPLNPLYKKPTATDIFSTEDASFFRSIDVSDWEYRCLNDQNPSSKPRARHFLLKELNFAMSDLTSRK
jgi:hypothetical protein